MDFTRRTLCRLTRDLLVYTEGECLTKQERKIALEYWDAVRSIDQDKLEFFFQFGPSVRHQVMNVEEYRQGLRYGFTQIKLNDCNWLDNSEWTTVEEISLRINDDRQADYNRITLVCGLNGKWTFGMSHTFGGSAGGGFAANVFHRPAFNSRTAVCDFALREMKKKFEDQVQHAVKYPDPGNYKVPYMNKVIAKIDSLLIPEDEQLSLF